MKTPLMVIALAGEMFFSSCLCAQSVMQQADSPKDVVAQLSHTRGLWPSQVDEFRVRVMAAPDAYVPVFREALRLPKDPEALVQLPPEQCSRAERELQEHLADLSGLLAYHPVAWLGRERATPLLEEFFTGAWALWEETERRMTAQIRKERQANVAGPVNSESSEVTRLRTLRHFWRGFMARAVSEARAANTPVLVDPILRIYESRIAWDFDATMYLLQFRAERADIVPRLRRMSVDPSVDPYVRHYFQKALDRVEPPSDPQG